MVFVVTLLALIALNGSIAVLVRALNDDAHITDLPKQWDARVSRRVRIYWHVPLGILVASTVAFTALFPVLGPWSMLAGEFSSLFLILCYFRFVIPVLSRCSGW